MVDDEGEPRLSGGGAPGERDAAKSSHSVPVDM